MAWDYVYVIFLLLYILLMIAFYFRDESIGILSGFGIMIAGIYLYVNGAEGVSNFYTQSFAVINLGVGMYVSIRGAIELMIR